MTKHVKLKDSHEFVNGSFGGMMKARAEKLPEFKAELQEILDNYKGTPFAIVRIDEHENGNPYGALQYMGGIGGIKSMVKLISELESMKNQMMEVLVRSSGADPDVIAALGKELMEDK